MGEVGSDIVSDEEMKNWTPRRSRRNRRKVKKVRTDRDISNYDAWRCWDRELFISGFKSQYETKVFLSPKQVVHHFGTALRTRGDQAKNCIGYYMFEDDNLDLFILAEGGHTTMTHGLNKSDERYEY